MREHDLQAPAPRVGQAHGPKAHDGTITTPSGRLCHRMEGM